MLRAHAIATIVLAASAGSAPMLGPGDATPVTVRLLEDATFRYGGPAPLVTDTSEREPFVARHAGQVVETTIDLPEATATARTITLVVDIQPVVGADGRPHDPWTRLGSIAVALPSTGTGDDAGLREVELMRFATGYGGASHLEGDVTALAPWLHGRRTVRAFISTYAEESAWRLTADLRYDDDAGARRPAVALPLFNDPHVTRSDNFLSSRVVIPEGLDRPRIRLITTGHATDGEAENEFATCTHVLRIDDRVIARWRPWTEGSTATRPSNPWAGRRRLGDGELRSSDLDRSGWTPGRAVDPLFIPADELSPGPHEITLAVQGIRGAAEPGGPHGYFVVSAVVVADAPQPEQP